eukprot:1159200-Pelagomonas_calceolata.AAC.2
MDSAEERAKQIGQIAEQMDAIEGASFAEKLACEFPAMFFGISSGWVVNNLVVHFHVQFEERRPFIVRWLCYFAGVK